MNNKGIIEVSPLDVRGVSRELKESETILANAKKIVITTQPTYLESDTILKRIKAKLSELEEQRKKITGPLDAAKKAVMDLFRGPADFLKEAEDIIKTAQLTYLDDQERKRVEEEARLRKIADEDRRKKEAQGAEWRRKEEEKRREAERLAKAGKTAEADKIYAEADKAAAKAEERAVEAATVVAPTVAPVAVAKGSAIVVRWHAEVVDVNLLEKKYMVPNMEVLNKLAVACKDSVPPPAGVVFKSERSMTSRKATPDVGF